MKIHIKIKGRNTNMKIRIHSKVIIFMEEEEIIIIIITTKRKIKKIFITIKIMVNIINN